MQLAALAKLAKQRAKGTIPAPVLRQADTGWSSYTFAFRFSDAEATVGVVVFVPSADVPLEEWQVHDETPSPLLGRPHPGIEIDALRVGPEQVAAKARGHWPGCQVRGMTLYGRSGELTWTVFCNIAAGVVSGDVDGRTGTFVPSLAPPVRPPATATPQPTPESMTESSVVQPVVPWPPAPMRAKIIRLALSDPETAKALQGHHYLVMTVSQYFSKMGACSVPGAIECFEVGIYDYTAATGRVVIVNFVTEEVVDRRAVPEFTNGFPEEERAEMAAILAGDPRFGPQAQVDWRGVKLIDDTASGGQCGTHTPLHRCFMVRVIQVDGTTSWVTVDMVDRRVVRVGLPL